MWTLTALCFLLVGMPCMAALRSFWSLSYHTGLSQTMSQNKPLLPEVVSARVVYHSNRKATKIASTVYLSSLFLPVCWDPQQNPRNHLLARRERNPFLTKLLLKPLGPLVQSDLTNGVGNSHTSLVRHAAKDRRGKVIQRQCFFFFTAVSKAETPTLTLRETTALPACGLNLPAPVLPKPFCT